MFNRLILRSAKLLAAALIVMPLSSLAQQPAKFPVIPLNAGIHIIQAEVALSDAQHQQGLMYREKMAQNEGMVFLFENPTRICMWMKNTLLPLSVAFIDDSGHIINIEEMAPQTTASHCAKRPARYALEMNRGWFAHKNIKPGGLIGGLPRAK